MAREKKTDNWYPFFVGDYRRDTARLSCEQHGAYRQLIDEYWITGPLPDDDAILARIVGLELRVWRKHRAAIGRFFDVAGGVWTHGRIDRELTSASERRSKAEVKAKAAAEARWGKPQAPKPDATGNAPSIAQAQREECPLPPPQEKKEDADASSAASAAPKTAKAKPKGDPWAKDASFLSAWDACTDQMRRRSSRAKAWAKWRANPADGPAKLAALQAYLKRDPDVQRTGGPGLHIWLADKLAEWLAEPGETAIVAAAWDGPPDVRQAVERGFNDPAKAASYLRSCVFDEAERVLHSPNGFVVSEIDKQAGGELSAIGVKVQVRKARAA